MVSTIGVPKYDLRDHECYRDRRGIPTHCDFTIDGRRYLTFPGDFPVDETAPAGTLYVIKQTGDDTLIILCGKPADAPATDPVERFVFKMPEAELIEHTILTGHIGNQAYWRVEPAFRGVYDES